MDIGLLIESGSKCRVLAGETIRHVMADPARRQDETLHVIAFLLLDLSDGIAAAENAALRGNVRREMWEAATRLADKAAELCRAEGNDGQLVRCADGCAQLSDDWVRLAARLDDQDRQAAVTERPDPDAEAPEDPQLAEALRETFPASDPIAVPKRGQES